MSAMIQKNEVTLLSAASYQEVSQIALRVLVWWCAEFPGKKVGMVCGPISTGGLGSIPANLERFHLAITTLTEAGYPIFTQMPYEEALHRIRDQSVGPGVYDNQLLEEFYLPLFESG